MRKRIAQGQPCQKCGKLPAFKKRTREVLCGACGKGKGDVPFSRTPVHPNLKEFDVFS